MPRPEAQEVPAALFLIHDLRSGGAERVFLEYLYRILCFRIVPVLVRPIGSLMAGVPNHHPLYDLESEEGRLTASSDRLDDIPGGTLPARDGWISGSASLVAKSRRLVQIAEAESALVVSTFLHKSHVIALLGKLLFNSDLRVVVNVHEDPLQHIRTHFPSGRQPLIKAMYRRLLPLADSIAVVATGIQDQLIHSFKVPPRLIHVTPNPIDLWGIRQMSEEPPIDPDLPRIPGPLVVGVGRLEPVKGFDLLVRAISIAREHRPVRLALVGDGSERTRLLGLIRDLNLENSVSVLGHRENPHPFIAMADILVVPSRSEAWPCVIGEALALGTPVLATRCSPGVEEFLQEGRYGYLVPPEDEHSLASSILTLLDDPDLRESLALGGASRVAEFEPGITVPRYEEVVRAALEQRDVCHPNA